MNPLNSFQNLDFSDSGDRRFVIKKAARFSAALLASGPARLRSAIAGDRCVRALTYHRVGDVPKDAFCVNRDDFEQQMRRLAETSRAVSQDDVEAFVAKKRELPQASMPGGACLVTLDDGNISNLTEALPILERYQVPAVCFVTPSLVGADFDGLPERYMDWDELRELDKSPLITIGSHAYTHRSLGLMAIDEAQDEARRSKNELEDGLGHEVRSFAYPFGTRSDYSSATDRALADAGYHIAFNSMHGAIKAGADPISLPRVKVEGAEGLWMFERVATGAMDAWRIVDQNLYRLQRVRKEITGDGVSP